MAKSKKPAARKSKPAASKAAADAKAVATDVAKDVSAKGESAAAEGAKTVTAAKDTAVKAVSKTVETAKDDAPAKPAPKPETKAKPEPVKDTKPAPDAKPAAEAKSTASEMPKVERKVTPPPAPAPQEKRSGGFLPLVLGGVVAGGIGYGVSEYDLLGTRGQATSYDAEITSLTTQLGAQADQIAALENAEPVLPEIEMPDLGPVTQQVAAVAEQLDGIDARLTAVEKQPMSEGTSQVAIDAYERELAALQASAAAQRAEIEALIGDALSVKEDTAEAARTANVQAAMTKVTAAIGTGQPFAEALTALGENGVTDVPAALSEAAEDGVVTLSNLQTRFPDSARAALGAARASGGGGEEEAGLGGFLKRQLGARSVAPREGNDPDAVLSRAEAAVRDGQLDTALTEVDALPEAGQAAMQDWLDDAKARQAAVAAAADLSNSLTAN